MSGIKKLEGEAKFDFGVFVYFGTSETFRTTLRRGLLDAIVTETKWCDRDHTD
ncbi:MAG: hypothetical protein N2V72_06900 [Methanophagales archaeon]|nr:hypothetical protein [Methanophagales archaeon]